MSSPLGHQGLGTSRATPDMAALGTWEGGTKIFDKFDFLLLWHFVWISQYPQVKITFKAVKTEAMYVRKRILLPASNYNSRPAISNSKENRCLKRFYLSNTHPNFPPRDKHLWPGQHTFFICWEKARPTQLFNQSRITLIIVNWGVLRPCPENWLINLLWVSSSMVP